MCRRNQLAVTDNRSNFHHQSSRRTMTSPRWGEKVAKTTHSISLFIPIFTSATNYYTTLKPKTNTQSRSIFFQSLLPCQTKNNVISRSLLSSFCTCFWCKREKSVSLAFNCCVTYKAEPICESRNVFAEIEYLILPQKKTDFFQYIIFDLESRADHTTFYFRYRYNHYNVIKNLHLQITHIRGVQYKH